MSHRQTVGFRGWLDRLMAAIALLNLLLIAFDLSYIPLRDFYLRTLPQLTTGYGERFKGIEPYRETVAYLRTVDTLDALNNLDTPQAVALLRSLRTQSVEMIDQNPFEISGKPGKIEIIKNRMRDRMDVEGAKQAFAMFWSQEYLERVGKPEAIAFFDQRIRPVMNTNYYRGIGENGDPVNLFWQIDLPFVALFAIDLIVRLLYLRRRYSSMSWLDVLFLRWYDLFLLLPFWRWLRVIPVSQRLNQSRLANLEPLRVRAMRRFVDSFAGELTEVVVTNVIEQTQEQLRRSDLSRLLLQSNARRRYVDLNGVDEIEAITRQLTSVVVYQVLPQIRPNVETLMRYSIQQVLQSSPVYQGLRHVPGLGELSGQFSKELTDRLVTELTQVFYSNLTQMLENPEMTIHVRNLMEQAGQVFQQSITEGQTLQQIQALLVDLLDEIKVSYVDQISKRDANISRRSTRPYYEVAQGSKIMPRP